MPASLAWLALAGPLALLLTGLVPAARANANPRRMATLTLAAAALSLALAIVAAIAVALQGPLTTATLGVGGIGLAVHLDALSVVMACLVSFVGVVVLRYSRNYLDGDPEHGRFLQGLALTLAAVEILIVSGNLAQLILAWIATSVGLNRLLLFYGNRPAALLAARKKFVASRLGDAALIGAAALLYNSLGSLDLTALIASAKALATSGSSPVAVNAAGFLIVIAALLKSAQAPLHGWLIEVMETPTPVSALLHAGIINAGGFLILRLADIVSLNGAALETLAIVGGATALFGSVVLLTQTSVKVSLAWSTVAQMGFMMLQCGLGAFSAALLHILAHSLYKAHAFLSSGSVIDLARASWTPSPGGQPHPARLVLALVLVAGLTLAIAVLFGASPTAKPGAFALGAIVAMGLVHLIASAIDERPNGYVLAKAGGLAALVAASYFALQAGAEVLTAQALPATLPLRGPLDLAIMTLVVVSFGAVTVFQSLMARHADTPFWQGVYVHVSHGLYLNTLANRLVLRAWPRRPVAPSH